MEMLMRSMRRGQSVESRKIGRQTARRILSFAQPYRREIAVFLVVIILAAVIGVVTPVLAGRVVNTITGVLPGGGAAVVRIALLIAGLAVVSALLSLAERWYS